MINNDLSKRIEELTIDLTSVRSVVGTRDELNISTRIYDIFREMAYYKENSQLLELQDFENDSIGRKNVLAIVKGKKGNSKKTAVLIGHTDTVGISDYTGFEEYATKPYELAEKLKQVSLPEEARKDLNAGNWLFGRGIFDMKCGVATIIAIIENLTKFIDDFEGNIVFAAVGDEEGSSAGMLSFVPKLIELQQIHGFKYQAVVDTDYMAPRYDGDDNRYIYIGTVGKLMPSFLVVGKETHVGQPYKGLDPNQISSSLITKINSNMAFSDVVEGEVTLPPITLRQRDLKKEYSVQIATKSNLFFNYATHNSTPDQVLAKMKKVAFDVFDEVVKTLNERYEIYCKSSGYPYDELPWKARVLSYNELYNLVKGELGDALDQKIENLKRNLLQDPSIDERAFTLRIVEEVHSLWSDKNPVIIVYFSPPYYPHIYVEGKNDKEQNLLNAVSQSIEKLNTDYNIVQKKFYPYISDLSFVSAPQDMDVIANLMENMPAFGSKYNLPLEEMQALNLPVVNIGPFGKDAHQYTERIEKEYSFNIAPKLVYETILNILK
ncbi:M20/M25/M40 family metallo-hydrolase [Clostridiaceae bacterium 35-E11]